MNEIERALATLQDLLDNSIFTSRIDFALEVAIEALREQAERNKEDAVVRGEWEVAIGYDPNKKVQCQNCYKMAYEPTSYCPNCGAKMEDKP
jgi:translation initiation factor 2 gamma subunit (eIF-2gamma)